MFQTGNVVPMSSFLAWIKRVKAADAGNAKYLPPYSGAYYPAPLRRAG